MFSTFLTIFVSSFIIALSGAMMPGPLLTATISESSRRGLITGCAVFLVLFAGYFACAGF